MSKKNVMTRKTETIFLVQQQQPASTHIQQKEHRCLNDTAVGTTATLVRTFEVAGYLCPLVADLRVHAQQQLVFLFGPGADVQAFLKVVGITLAALLVGSPAHQLGHLFRNDQDGVVKGVTRTCDVQVGRTS